PLASIYVAPHPAAAAHPPQPPSFPTRRSSGLQGRSAYQPLVHKQGDRWIAYIGHHGDEVANPLTGQREQNGTSILDVTNPKQPTDRKSTRLNSSHQIISYAVFCLKKKKQT